MILASQSAGSFPDRRSSGNGDKTGRRAALAKMAGRARQSPDRPGDRQPALAAPLRPGDRGHAQRLRRARRAAVASRAARLARLRAGRQGWRLKPLHRLMVTSATYRQSSQAEPEAGGRRSREHALRPDEPPPARCRRRPRRHAGRLGRAESQDGRARACSRRSRRKSRT